MTISETGGWIILGCWAVTLVVAFVAGHYVGWRDRDGGF